MNKIVFTGLVALSFLTVLLGASISHAAVISWQAPSFMIGEVDVVTTGTYVDSATMYQGGDLTENGVTFNHLSNQGVGMLGFANNSGITINNYSQLASGSTQFADAFLASYVGASAWQTNSGNNVDGYLKINLSNLIVGNQYIVQLWTPFKETGMYEATSFSAGNTSDLLGTGTLDSYDNIDSYAHYVIGTFTADASTQMITSNPKPEWSFVSGIQVRTLGVDTSVAAVPEPETYAMFLAG